MKSIVSEESLDKMFEATVKALTDKITNGTATAGDMSNAIKLLNMNNISASPSVSPGLAALATLSLDRIPDDPRAYSGDSDMGLKEAS